MGVLRLSEEIPFFLALQCSRGLSSRGLIFLESDMSCAPNGPDSWALCPCLVPDCSELARHHSRYRLLTTTALINGPFIGAFIEPLFPRQLRYPPDTLVPPRGGVAQDSGAHQPFRR